jgi:hypothetical protein
MRGGGIFSIFTRKKKKTASADDPDPSITDKNDPRYRPPSYWALQDSATSFSKEESQAIREKTKEQYKPNLDAKPGQAGYRKPGWWARHPKLKNQLTEAKEAAKKEPVPMHELISSKVPSNLSGPSDASYKKTAAQATPGTKVAHGWAQEQALRAADAKAKKEAALQADLASATKSLKDATAELAANKTTAKATPVAKQKAATAKTDAAPASKDTKGSALKPVRPAPPPPPKKTADPTQKKTADSTPKKTADSTPKKTAATTPKKKPPKAKPPPPPAKKPPKAKPPPPPAKKTPEAKPPPPPAKKTPEAKAPAEAA